jgi:aminoglycoside phosphotransferase (APT) family kinase protein
VHGDQISVSSEQVAALLADQQPALAGLEVVRIDAAGTVNAIFRIGDSVAARFPLRHDDPAVAARRLRREAAASAEFVSASPVPAPEPLGIGLPGHGYPLPWTTQTWLSGSTTNPTADENSAGLALDLAGLVQQLRGWDTRGRRFTGPGRGGRLSDHDVWVDQCITRSDDLVDTDAMRALWSRFRDLPREDPDAMCHGDLIPTNVLVSGDRLTGVLDTGGFEAADPALDLVAAWHFFADRPRERMRAALECSDLQWERGAAWAFEQAIGAYWYYQDTNPTMADIGRTTLERLVSCFS